MKQTFGMFFAMCALAAMPALAQTKPASSKTPSSKPAAAQHADQGKGWGTDTAFAKEAALGGMAEVELGNLAKEKASNNDVKQFGDRMVTDHSKANDELKQWASQKNVTLPTKLDQKHQATRDRLAKLSGAAFDREYMRDMVMDHQQDVAAFTRESKTGKDPDLKAWAGKTLPTLQDHLKMAKDTASKVGMGHTTAKK
jgi:putative membrane protein